MNRCRLLFPAAFLAVAVVVGVATEAASSKRGAAGERPISAKDFARQKFDRSTRIDNRWFPLRPGTQFILEGATNEGPSGERVPHRQVFTVTDLTKRVDGVRVLVVWDRDYSSGELVEEELAFFAQDNDGNVWHLGQYPEVHENGKVVEIPAFVSGVAGARAGIEMKADPKLGAPSYSKGYAPPPINWTDRSRAYRTGLRNCVPAGCYDNVLVTDEFNPDQPGQHQLKYYAPGLGNIRAGWMGKNDADKEVLVLRGVKRLGSEAMGKVRAAVSKIDRRAYVTRKSVYGHTEPAERMR
jgi:hypothetical protein